MSLRSPERAKTLSQSVMPCWASNGWAPYFPRFLRKAWRYRRMIILKYQVF